MFAQVSCGQCRKPFQVPQAKLGQAVPCPWCQRSGVPLPLVGIVAEALPDEGPPSPTLQANRANQPVRGLLARPVVLTLFVLLCFLVMATAFFGSSYYRGAVPGFVWVRFASPDGTCRAELPGAITESDQPADPNSPVTRGGKQFLSNSMLARIGGFVGWSELNPELLKVTRTDDILAAERERRKQETGWEVEAVSVAAKVSGFDALEVRYSSGSMKAIERYVCVTRGPQPRLYRIGVSGDGLNPDGETARRVLGSLWFTETR